jgi:hypothetical protein
MIDFIRAGGYVMFVLLALGVPLVVVAVKFASNASPQRLSMIRALTWAIVFAAVSGSASGFMMVATGVARDPEWLAKPLPILLQGFAEAITPIVLGGGLLMVAWTLVAFGVRRMPKDPADS